ncbi:hypothetical protein BDC45DRAFT_509184 [Circinella umbellata]|nr:hypothetical protein BDC45DRAFT_509184 [Circinella umbellata]
MEQNICCTQVCHTWRSFILTSWGGLWNELSDSNCNFIQDLTPYHISGRQVKILEMNARKRRKQSKEIKFLVSKKCHHIQTAHLNFGLSKQNFLKLFRLMGSSLRVLTMRNHATPSSDIIFNIILRDCSNLNHLTFYTAPHYARRTITTNDDNDPNNNNKRKWDFLQCYHHHQLQSLALYMHGQTNDIMPLDRLLQSCSQLRRISINPYDFPDTNGTLYSIYQFAPVLETLYYGYNLKSWTAKTIANPSFSTRIREKAMVGGGGTLRHLHLSELIHVEEHTLISFIQKNNKTLEIMDLNFLPNLSNETISNLAMFQFPHLKRFTLGMSNNITDDDNDNSVTTEEEDDYLVLSTTTATTNSRRNTVSQTATATSALLVNNLSTFLRRSPNLEQLYIYNLTAINNLLFRTIANHLHYLHSVTVAFCDQVSSGSILLFIQQYASSSANTNNNLKRLSFQGMDGVNNQVMELLGIKMKHHLEFLDVSECENIDDVGICSFVDQYYYYYHHHPKQQQESAIIKLKELSIWSCFSVSQDAIEYAQYRLGSQNTSVRYNY